MNKLKHLINHVAFVVDASGSMRWLTTAVIKVFDAQVANLITQSKETNQETRVSVYLFNHDVHCLVYDMDVLRLPSLKGHYHAGGNTALRDAAGQTITELGKTPELHDDHAFLIYVLTDGIENASTKWARKALRGRMKSMPANWTLACLVPNAGGISLVIDNGFPPDNIAIWNTTEQGLEDVGTTITQATTRYFQARAQGVRSTRCLFKVGLDASISKVRAALTPLAPHEYDLLNVRDVNDPAKLVIKRFVEDWKLPFRPGANYYELMKPEIIQANKQVIVQDKLRGTLYAGRQARDLLGLPGHEVKVQPGDFNDWRIFVQSNASNRNLVPGTQLVVMR